MTMTGIEILKLLPRIDCQKCGYPSCLAFAKALLEGKASLEMCQRLTEPARKMLIEKGVRGGQAYE